MTFVHDNDHVHIKTHNYMVNHYKTRVTWNYKEYTSMHDSLLVMSFLLLFALIKNYMAN